MSKDFLMGTLPTARRVKGPDTPEGYTGTVRVLQPASKELVALLRRNLREIPARDLEQDGKVFSDRETGEEFRLLTSHVDPTAPEESGVTAFAVRDALVCYLRPLDASGVVKSVQLGSIRGRQA